jgi:uncharacterized membrane protein YbaN (DUF454 family)
MLHFTRILLWRLLAGLSLLLGLLGVFLPGLPTVPFILLAAWAGSRGWPQLETYLLNHPVYGASIRNWRERGAISRRAKWIASIAVTISSLMLWISPLPIWFKCGVILLLFCVVFWLWHRAEN